jgi:hypothetical protein
MSSTRLEPEALEIDPVNEGSSNSEKKDDEMMESAENTDTGVITGNQTEDYADTNELETDSFMREGEKSSKPGPAFYINLAILLAALVVAAVIYTQARSRKRRNYHVRHNVNV